MASIESRFQIFYGQLIKFVYEIYLFNPLQRDVSLKNQPVFIIYDLMV